MSVEVVEAPAPIEDDRLETGDQMAEFLREATGELTALAALLRQHRDRRDRS